MEKKGYSLNSIFITENLGLVNVQSGILELCMQIMQAFVYMIMLGSYIEFLDI